MNLHINSVLVIVSPSRVDETCAVELQLQLEQAAAESVMSCDSSQSAEYNINRICPLLPSHRTETMSHGGPR